MKNEEHPWMKREAHSRGKRSEGRLPAAAHRSRQSQHRDVIEKEADAADEPYNTEVSENIAGEMTDESIEENEEMRRPEFHDSDLPPPPQLRRARSTADPKRRVQDKNTGIKHREASGKKHYARGQKTG